MGFNPEKKYILKEQRSLLEMENEKILNSCGLTSLFTKLRSSVVSDLDLKRSNQVAYKLQPGVDWESLSLICVRGDFSKFNEKPCQSLVITASIKNENTIHLMSREFKKNGEIKTESSDFDISSKDEKEKMFKKINSKFSTSLISSRKN